MNIEENIGKESLRDRLREILREKTFAASEVGELWSTWCDERLEVHGRGEDAALNVLVDRINFIKDLHQSSGSTKENLRAKILEDAYNLRMLAYEQYRDDLVPWLDSLEQEFGL